MMSQSIDSLLSDLLAAYNVHNRSVGASDGHVVTHQSPMESVEPWLVSGSVVSQHQCMFCSVAYILSNVFDRLFCKLLQ